MDVETGLRLGINDEVKLGEAGTARVPVLLEVFQVVADQRLFERKVVALGQLFVGFEVFEVDELGQPDAERGIGALQVLAPREKATA